MSSGCEVAVCEAQCVVGSVIRPVDPFLPPMYTHCGHTAGPSGQPLQPHHFPSLGGMTGEGRRNGRAAFHWLLPRCGLSVSVRPSVSAVHRGRIEGHSGENREGVFLYPKTNPSPSHATFSGGGGGAPGPQRARPTSVGHFISCRDTHRHTAAAQTFIQSEPRCPVISLSLRTASS